MAQHNCAWLDPQQSQILCAAHDAHIRRQPGTELGVLAVAASEGDGFACIGWRVRAKTLSALAVLQLAMK